MGTALTCPACSGPMHRRALPLDRAVIALCVECGHGVNVRSARRVGPTDYASASNGRGEYERVYLAARQAGYRAGLRELGDGRGRSLLDFGCNYGHFLQLARREGWAVRGFEPGSSLREAALPDVRSAIAGSFELAAEEGPYDAITMWDVLEHLDEPALHLDRLRSLLRPDGVLLVRVPDARVFAALRTRLPWRACQDVYLKLCHPVNPEEHRHHFTPASLTRMAGSAQLEPGEAHAALPSERVVAGRTRADTAIRGVLHRAGRRLPYEFTMVMTPLGAAGR
jgi:SAM-dependent methyltransferase